MDYQTSLKILKPEHGFFVGIDSDGCVFDTMEVKQKEFFIPNALKYFDLSGISTVLQETWEFVNLYSVYRGGNRFTSLIKVFELLSERKEILDSGCKLPDLKSLKTWMSTESKLGNASLRSYFELNYSPDLEKVVRWTEKVNEDIGKRLRKIPPFPYSKTSIEKMSPIADLMVVSQTPLEALDREWQDNDLKRYIKTIAAQEHGTKTEHIALAAKGKYPDNKILMIGDAKGDLDAAKNNGVLFYPIIPGKEDETWKDFLNEGFNRFTTGNYEGSYENNLIKEFQKYLPETPPWKKELIDNKI